MHYNKKHFNLIMSAFLLLAFFFSSAGLPEVAYAATVKTPSKTSITKTTTKKVSSKKKKVIRKKKEKLVIDPPLITLDTVPHSPKPISKSKSKKKKTTTKKITTKKTA